MCTKKINVKLDECDSEEQKLPEEYPKKKNWLSSLIDFEAQTQQVIEDCSQSQPTTSVYQHDEDEEIIRCTNISEEQDSELLPQQSQSPIIGQDKSPSMRNRLLSISSTLNIEDVVEQPEPLTQIEIEELLTQEDTLFPSKQIVNFDTQLHSTVITSSTSSSTCTPTSDNIFSPGNPSASLSKKRLKPRGIAQQAIKALRDQKTLNDIWTHSKHRMDSIDPNNTNSDTLRLLVTDEIYEFSRRILVCASVSTTSPCLLLAPTGVENVVKGRRVSVYPPFARKFIDYRGSFVSFYFGAERMLWDEDGEAARDIDARM